MPGQAPGGAPADSTESTDEDTLLEKLLKYLEEQRAKEEDTSTQAADMAQQVLDILLGFDEEA